MSRAVASYSSEVLAEFIRVRGISFFPEELDFIEERLSTARFRALFRQQPCGSDTAKTGEASGTAVCQKCHGFGQLPTSNQFCDCRMGKDLLRAAAAVARDKAPRTQRSPDEIRQALRSYGMDE